jgi:hypothetical protein
MGAYLRLHNVEVKMATIDLDGNLADYDEAIERARLEKVKPLIHVVQDRGLNAVGTRSGRNNPLSVSWFETDLKKRGAKQVGQLKNNVYTFFHRHAPKLFGGADVKSDECLWSTYKTFKGRVKGKGFTKSFAPCNARSTNQFRDRKALAYLLNLWHHPYIRAFFEDAKAPISEDMYALLVMTQWVWRSQIRDRKPIALYIPSDRMRTLFCDWLEGKLPAVPKEAGERIAKVEQEKVDAVDEEAEAELAQYA